MLEQRAHPPKRRAGAAKRNREYTPLVKEQNNCIRNQVENNLTFQKGNINDQSRMDENTIWMSKYTMNPVIQYRNSFVGVGLKK